MTGGDEAIAAIIAGPAQHRDGACVAKPPEHRIGDSAPGILHERQARHTTLGRQVVGAAHFLSGQKLEH